MLNDWLTDWLRWWGGVPAFLIFGKSSRESEWRTISVYTTSRRDFDSRWPLWRGTCVTWTSTVISMGDAVARQIIDEQALEPASRATPVVVAGGRLRNPMRRSAASAPELPTASEVLAHECGHTWQALRLGPAYLLLVGSVTLFGEGPHSWNHFENDASEHGQFGGLVAGSVRPDLRGLHR